MCIRDRGDAVRGDSTRLCEQTPGVHIAAMREQRVHCLLYTSDAADERSSVDLGGRRIIKKKNTTTHDERAMCSENMSRDHVAVTLAHSDAL